MAKTVDEHLESILKIEEYKNYYRTSEKIVGILRNSKNIEEFCRSISIVAVEEELNLRRESNLLVINEELVVDFNRLKEIKAVTILLTVLIIFKKNGGWDKSPAGIYGANSIVSYFKSNKGERLKFVSAKRDSKETFLDIFNDTFDKLNFNFELKFSGLSYHDYDRLDDLISKSFVNYITDFQQIAKFVPMFNKCANFAINMHKRSEKRNETIHFIDFIAYLEFALALIKDKYKNTFNEIKTIDYVHQIEQIWKNVNINIENEYDIILGQIKYVPHLHIEFNYLDDDLQNYISVIKQHSLQFETIPLLIYHACKHGKDISVNDYLCEANSIKKNSNYNIESNILQYGDGRRFIFETRDNSSFVIVIGTSFKAIIATYIIRN